MPDPQMQPMDRFDWERVIKRLRIAQQFKYIALMLATYAAPDGTQVFPGVDELVDVTCTSKATVKRGLTELRRLGLIELVSRADRYAGLADEYRLTVPADIAEMPMLPPEQLGRNRARR
ncbi:helix-turn-helix domain-containing protein [Nocardia sp. CC201C]|uniref:helix-turn-helix domain-containing protein n=1 Tax=Nocardia sp. CC201C TaxID=3044575 RepID=UPI0024A910B4|nr:helix-turn-helix domain-containing protein [Nocardia sp. CC201C]